MILLRIVIRNTKLSMSTDLKESAIKQTADLNRAVGYLQALWMAEEWQDTTSERKKEIIKIIISLVKPYT